MYCSIVGCRKLQEVGVTKILLEGMGKPEAAAEGATLGLWLYQEFKNKIKQKKAPQLEFYGEENVEERYIGFISFRGIFYIHYKNRICILWIYLQYGEQMCVLAVNNMLVYLSVVSEHSWLNSGSDPKRFYAFRAK
jgi:hypothetical protein